MTKILIPLAFTVLLLALMGVVLNWVKYKKGKTSGCCSDPTAVCTCPGEPGDQVEHDCGHSCAG